MTPAAKHQPTCSICSAPSLVIFKDDPRDSATWLTEQCDICSADLCHECGDWDEATERTVCTDCRFTQARRAMECAACHQPIDGKLLGRRDKTTCQCGRHIREEK